MLFRILFIGADTLWDFGVLFFLAGIAFGKIRTIFWYFYFRGTRNIGWQFNNN